jgi:type IX secretion system PorP/SprF family membrane protein
MKKTLLSLVLVAVSFSFLKAQQDPQLTQFMYDRLSVNPAFAGMNKAICGTMFYRQQWSGFPENPPKTMLFNLHAPVFNTHGLGLTVFNDQLGQENTTAARLSYSFHRQVGIGTFGAGLSLGMLNKRMGSDWLPPDGIGSIGQDNSINDADIAETTFDLGLGLYYTTDKVYVGLSTTHLSQSEFGDLYIENARHYWIMAGYNHELPQYNLELRPAMLIKSDGASTQFDFNVTALYNKMVWLGVSYRMADAFAPMIGFQQQMGADGTLRIGIGYDVTTSQLRDHSNGSYEVFVNYCFNLDKPKPVQQYRNVRFL